MLASFFLDAGIFFLDMLKLDLRAWAAIIEDASVVLGLGAMMSWTSKDELDYKYNLLKKKTSIT